MVPFAVDRPLLDAFPSNTNLLYMVKQKYTCPEMQTRLDGVKSNKTAMHFEKIKFVNRFGENPRMAIKALAPTKPDRLMTTDD